MDERKRTPDTKNKKNQTKKTTHVDLLRSARAKGASVVGGEGKKK